MHWFLHATKFLREILFNYNRIHFKKILSLLSPVLSAPLFTRPKSILRVPNTGSTTRENNTPLLILTMALLSVILLDYYLLHSSVQQEVGKNLMGESIAFTFSFNIPDTDVVWLAALLHVYLPDSHHLPFPSPLTQFQVNHTTSSTSSFLQAFLSGSRSEMCGDLQKCCAGIDNRFFAPN